MANIRSGKGALGNQQSFGKTTPSPDQKSFVKDRIFGGFSRRLAERREESQLKQLDKAKRKAEREKDLKKVEEVKKRIENEQNILRGIQSGQLNREALEKIEDVKKTPKEEQESGLLPKETKEKREQEQAEFERKSTGKGESKVFPKGFQKKRKIFDEKIGRTVFTSKLPEREVIKQNPDIVAFTEGGEPIFKRIMEEPTEQEGSMPKEKESEKETKEKESEKETKEKESEKESEKEDTSTDSTTSAVFFGGQGSSEKRFE